MQRRGGHNIPWLKGKEEECPYVRLPPGLSPHMSNLEQTVCITHCSTVQSPKNPQVVVEAIIVHDGS